MTQDNSSAQLERCPFCGGDAVLGSLPESWGTDNDGRYGVECDKCGAQAPSRGRTKGEARAAWNTRAPVSQDAAQLVERLRALADYLTYEGEDEAAPIVAEAADLIEALTRVQPSTSSVEAVARALAKADGKDPDAPAWVQGYGKNQRTFGVCWRDQYADKAEAALSALPSPERELMELLRQRAETVVWRFEKDEAQGYRSKDRTYVIEMLKPALAPPPTQSGDRT